MRFKKRICGLLLATLLLAACTETTPVSQPPLPTVPGVGSGVASQMRPLTDARFTYAEEFCNGYAFAVQGQDCGYVDANGRFTAYYQREAAGPTGGVALDDATLTASDHNQMPVSEEGLFPCYNGAGLWGYAAITTGEWVIPAQFADAFPFREGLAIVQMPGQGAYQVIDTAGSLQFAIAAPLELHFTNNSLLVAGAAADGTPQLRLLDWTGYATYTLPTAGWEAVPGVHGLWRAAGDTLQRGDAEHLAVHTAEGTAYLNIAIQPVAQTPVGAQRGSAWQKHAAAAFYQQNGLWGLFDEEGPLTEPIFAAFYPLMGDATFVSEDGAAWYMIDAAGNRLTPETYTDGGPQGEENLLPTCANGQWGYLTAGGALGIGFRYSAAQPFYGGVAAVQQGEAGTWSYIDRRGLALDCPLAPQDSYPVQQGFALVREQAGYTWAFAADETGAPTDDTVQQLRRRQS